MPPATSPDSRQRVAAPENATRKEGGGVGFASDSTAGAIGIRHIRTTYLIRMPDLGWGDHRTSTSPMPRCSIQRGAQYDIPGQQVTCTRT